MHVHTLAAQDVRVALKKYHAEYSVQNAKDKKTYGGMFASNEGLYSKREQEEMKKAPPSRENKATIDISDAELRARAKAMGINLVRVNLPSPVPRRGVSFSRTHRTLHPVHDFDVDVITLSRETGQSKGPQGDGGPRQSATRGGDEEESR